MLPTYLISFFICAMGTVFTLVFYSRHFTLLDVEIIIDYLENAVRDYNQYEQFYDIYKTLSPAQLQEALNILRGMDQLARISLELINDFVQVDP